VSKIPLLAPRLLCALSLQLLSRNVRFIPTCDCTSRTLEFAPHALPHIFDFTCLLTTTSDSSIVRAVGVEPTILTTIGIRLLSLLRFLLDPLRSLFFLCSVLSLSGTFPHYHKPTIHLHTRIYLFIVFYIFHYVVSFFDKQLYYPFNHNSYILSCYFRI